MTTMFCTCGNTARYINERGELCCGICPIKEGVDSIRIADVPALLTFSRSLLVGEDSEWIDGYQPHGPVLQIASYRAKLHEIIGRSSAPVPIPIRERTSIVLPTVFAESLEEEASRFAAAAPLVITDVEQLLNDQTYETYVPTSADGEIIGEALAKRLKP